MLEGEWLEYNDSSSDDSVLEGIYSGSDSELTRGSSSMLGSMISCEDVALSFASDMLLSLSLLLSILLWDAVHAFHTA